MHNGMPGGGSTETHSIPAVQVDRRTATVDPVTGAAENHGGAMSVQAADLAEHSQQPTPSPRRQMPSGLSASISPVERQAGSLNAASHDDLHRPEPGALPAVFQVGTVVAAAAPTAVGGGNGQISAGIAGGNVNSEANRSQAAVTQSVRESADYQKVGMIGALAPAPAPAPVTHGHPAQTVAGAAPDLARVAGLYQGNAAAGIPTFMHSQGGPFDAAGMRDNGVAEPPAFQVLGERLDSPPDVRILDAILLMRHGEAPTGWSGGDSLRGGRGGNGASAVMVCWLFPDSFS